MKQLEEPLIEYTPPPGSHWVHKNGNRYKVLLITNAAATQPEYILTIVYEGENGYIWSRPLSEWLRSYTPEQERSV